VRPPCHEPFQMRLKTLTGWHTASGCRGLPSRQSAMTRLRQRPTGRATGHRLHWYAHAAHPRMRQLRMSRSGSVVASPRRLITHLVRSSLSCGPRRFWVGGRGALFWVWMGARPPAVDLLAPGVPLMVLAPHGLTPHANW